MTKHPRLLLVLLVVVLIACGAVVLIVKQGAYEVEVAFAYKNTQSVKLYDGQETVGDGDNKLIAPINQPGQVIKLKLGHKYIVKYEASNGYADGNFTFQAEKDKKTVAIDPFYSDEKLGSLLPGEINAVSKAYSDAYSSITAYVLEPGRLYHFGEWYGATLKYTGNDTFNDDSLRVVLHKENGSWVIKTQPPDITLSKYIYTDIPADVLRSVNNL